MAGSEAVRRGARGPAPRTRTADQEALLAELATAARRRREADEAYAAGIVAAREGGVTYAAIAETLGISVEAVRKMLRRHA